MSHPVGIIGVMTSYPIPTWLGVRYGAHRVARPTVAAEPRGGYDLAPAAVATSCGAAGSAGAAGSLDDGSSGAEGAPFGLAVLTEVPRLAAALEAIEVAERRMLDAVVVVGELLADDEVAQTTGVSVEHWLAIVCRQTRMDRRLLLRLGRLLGRFPALAAGVGGGRVSFAQLRGVGIVLRQAPPAIDAELDGLIGRLLEQLQGADPDVLVDQLRQAIVELAPLAAAEVTDTVTNRLVLQPNLAGTGGRFAGELDTLGLAILDEATAPTRDQLDHPDGMAGARADNLLTRLAGHPGGEVGDPDGDATDTAGDAGVGDGVGVSGVAGRRVQAGGLLAPVKLLARVQLETLGQLPAELLTRLTGGQLKLTAQAAKYLCDQQQVALRLVVIDEGEVVGVGRQTRQPPGWLADVVAAVHDTCTEPLCQRPARTAELDHADPWWPESPHAPYGTTDADNLGPLCGTTNRTPGRGGWQPTQTGDGRRTWTHPRTGLSITTVPTTWRPAGWRPPCQHRHCHHPPAPHHRHGHGPGTGTDARSGRRARAPNDPDGDGDAERTSDHDEPISIHECHTIIHGTPPRAPQPPPPDPDDLPF
jgi:hypothetical protein